MYNRLKNALHMVEILIVLDHQMVDSRREYIHFVKVKFALQTLKVTSSYYKLRVKKANSNKDY